MTAEPRRFSIRMAPSLKFFVLMLVPLTLCGLFVRSCANAHSRPIGEGDTFDVSDSAEAIVFNAVGKGGRDLYVLRLSDSRVMRIAETPDHKTSPCVSPNGKSVVYAAGVPGDRADHVFVRSLDGTPARQLTRGDANDSS